MGLSNGESGIHKLPVRTVSVGIRDSCLGRSESGKSDLRYVRLHSLGCNLSLWRTHSHAGPGNSKQVVRSARAVSSESTVRPRDGLCTLPRRAVCFSLSPSNPLAVPQASVPTLRRRPPVRPSITVNTRRVRHLVRDHVSPDSPLLFIGELYPLRTSLITTILS
jgi:hypothetical protein